MTEINSTLGTAQLISDSRIATNEGPGQKQLIVLVRRIYRKCNSDFVFNADVYSIYSLRNLIFVYLRLHTGAS